MIRCYLVSLLSLVYGAFQICLLQQRLQCKDGFCKDCLSKRQTPKDSVQLFCSSVISACEKARVERIAQQLEDSRLRKEAEAKAAAELKETQRQERAKAAYELAERQRLEQEALERRLCEPQYRSFALTFTCSGCAKKGHLRSPEPVGECSECGTITSELLICPAVVAPCCCFLRYGARVAVAQSLTAPPWCLRSTADWRARGPSTREAASAQPASSAKGEYGLLLIPCLQALLWRNGLSALLRAWCALRRSPAAAVPTVPR
jgi:hypothetical protein